MDSVSLMNSWTTKKKRTLKTVKSKNLSSCISKEVEEEGCRKRKRSRVSNKKQKLSRGDNDSVVKRKQKRSRKIVKVESEDEIEAIPISDSEDYNCTLSEWIQKLKEEKRNKPKEVVVSGEYFETDDYTTGNWISEKRRERLKAEREEDMEWEEELEMLSKIKTTSRSRTRNLCSNSPENVTDEGPSCSRSPASEVSDSLLKNGIFNDCTIMKTSSKVICL